MFQRLKPAGERSGSEAAIGPKRPQIDPREGSEILKYTVHRGNANPRCLPGGGSTVHWPQRALCAAAILFVLQPESYALLPTSRLVSTNPASFLASEPRVSRASFDS
jgi:hypothetical protein